MRAWLLMSLFLAGPLLAADPAKAVAPVDPVSSLYLFKITLALLGIVLLIFVLAWAARKMQLTPTSGQQLIRVLSAVPVGSRDRIALIEVGEEQILLGLSPGRIQKLHVLSSPLQLDEPQRHLNSPFARKLAGLMNASKARPSSATAPDAGPPS
jgi:flagellar protein FliO/FliZ